MSEPHDRTLLRVRRGRPTAEELTAITAVLLACARRKRDLPRDGLPPGAEANARWRRPERTAVFEDPRSWRRDGT
ncbi:acyl-CoA carboxylase subunit epsilon [Streptosporangium sp. NPDC000239]|uniref:Acyl-CoA carboxylase subunit epsilon n=1 Tax=Streptosporangium jomthongense TaxID=1193683 RepID=A0ABV8ETK7_9ACTN